MNKENHNSQQLWRNDSICLNKKIEPKESLKIIENYSNKRKSKKKNGDKGVNDIETSDDDIDDGNQESSVEIEDSDVALLLENSKEKSKTSMSKKHKHDYDSCMEFIANKMNTIENNNDNHNGTISDKEFVERQHHNKLMKEYDRRRKKRQRSDGICRPKKQQRMFVLRALCF